METESSLTHPYFSLYEPISFYAQKGTAPYSVHSYVNSSNLSPVSVINTPSIDLSPIPILLPSVQPTKHLSTTEPLQKSANIVVSSDEATISNKYKGVLVEMESPIVQKTPDEEWMEMYQRLVTFKKEHKTTQVPKRYEHDRELARWVQHQRKYCENLDQIGLLNEIGFVWSGSESWMEMYQRLVEYQKEHKTTHIPQRSRHDLKLARWVCTQRYNCKDQERINLLNDIGFIWKPKRNVHYKRRKYTRSRKQGSKSKGDKQKASSQSNQVN